MRVNGQDLLTFKYDILSATEAVYNNNGVTLLNVTYDPLGRPLRWTPTEPFVGMQLKYDKFGQMQQWQWGDQRESFTYDNNGRFESVTYADGTKMSYSYGDDQSDKVTFVLSYFFICFPTVRGSLVKSGISQFSICRCIMYTYAYKFLT